MKIELKSCDLGSCTTPLAALGVFAGDGWDTALKASPVSAVQEAARVAAEEGFKAKDGQTFLYHQPGGEAARILFVGLGERDALEPSGIRAYAAKAVAEAKRRKLKGVAIFAPDGVEAALAARHLTEGASLGTYRYTEYLSDEEAKVQPVEVAQIAFPGADVAALESVVAEATAAAESVAFARDLVNAPPVKCTPAYLAEKAEEIAKEVGLELVVFDEERIVKEGMNLLNAVGVGSANPPRLIHLTYRPEGAGPDTPQIALVGKGLTYDSGGYNIKPTGSLEDMKVDMSGAAAVLGAMKAIRSVSPKIIVHGIIASAENLVSSRAYKPGDVFRSYQGKSVEIMNTDAEGRLVLADALTYAEKVGSTKIVDLATLTGACMVALGPYIAGLFANDRGFGASLEAAAEEAGESVWQLPLSKKLRGMLKSPIADMKNIGARWGGAITAALFLEEFVGDATWAHLDIAGPASTEKAEPGTPEGGTGYGVMTLLRLLAAEK